jgi:hypothetical protein
MCEMDSICVGKPRLGSVKIIQPGGILLFKKLNIQGGDDSAILLNLPKEVVSI